MSDREKFVEVQDEAWIQSLSEQAVKSSLVDTSLYARYEVKRGLRDLDGKGVLAGLTQIGEVQGYTESGTKSVPGPGRLIYRGIEISELVSGFWSDGRNGFEEAAYLLLFGDLPDEGDLQRFHALLAANRDLPHDFIHDAILALSSCDMMNAMSRTLLSMYTLDEHPDDIDIPNVLRQGVKLIAVFPLLAAYAYRTYAYRHGGGSLVIHAPRRELSAAANFLHMLREDSAYTPLEERLLDLSLVLHAEHGGGNNSSFTTHVVTSSGTDTYSAIAAAMGSLKGPRHGGANIKVVQMFAELKEQVKNWDNDKEIEDYLLKLLKKEAFDRSGLIYGVGHAVYSVSDPRTVILREHVEKLAGEKGVEEEYHLYRRVEQLAPELIGHSRKIYKGVSANVDFYSGLLYRLLDIPMELYTPLFAMARIVGWCAHRIEELANGGKIIRPAYKSVREQRSYTPLLERS